MAEGCRLRSSAGGGGGGRERVEVVGENRRTRPLRHGGQRASPVLPASTRPPAVSPKINLLTEHFCGLCYYYPLWLPCLCVTAQLLPYMELICHNTVKAGFVAGLSLLMVIESSEYKRGKNRHPLLKDKPA